MVIRISQFDGVDRISEVIGRSRVRNLPKGIRRVIAEGKENVVILEEPILGEMVTIIEGGEEQYAEQASEVIKLGNVGSGFKTVIGKDDYFKEITVLRERG